MIATGLLTNFLSFPYFVEGLTPTERPQQQSVHRTTPLSVAVPTIQSKVAATRPTSASLASMVGTGGNQLIQTNATITGGAVLTSRSDTAWHDVGVLKQPKCTVSMYSAHTNDAGISVEVIK